MTETQVMAQSGTDSSPKSEPKWLDKSWLEPRFVALTALALALSFIGDKIGIPPWLDTVLAIIAYSAGGFYGARTAIHSLFVERQIDVDMLMVLAALGAAVIGEWHEGAVLLFLFSLSNVLQDYAIGRSRNAIKSLFKLYPEEARVRRGDDVITVTIDQINMGETVLIEPGERIPVDGKIVAGRSAVDQSPITGESMPVEKGVGDTVFAGTLNKQGALDVKATRPAGKTTLARIIQLVEEAQDAKAPTERFLDRFEQIYAGLIIFGVLLFIVIPPLVSDISFESNFYRAMVLMTVASPCALVISVPASFISAIAASARQGVLFKGGAYLEQLATIKAITFDKTGTLTAGKPKVTDIVTLNGISENELLQLTASAESRSEHPLAKAIVEDAHGRGITLSDPDDFEAVAGKGVRAVVDGREILLGSPNFMQQSDSLPEPANERLHALAGSGKTVMLVKQNDQWAGMVALADQLRPEAVNAVRWLREQGIEVAMLTGDNARVAQSIAREVGIDRFFADLLPEDKVDAIKQIQNDIGTVAMVGDGVNDAPALAVADIGIAMGAAGTDVALETADLVLMGDRLELIERAIDLSKKARRVVWQNIAFSLAVIVMLIAGVFIIDLPLPLGVLGHEGSTVLVVLNGLIQLLLWPSISRQGRKDAIQTPVPTD